MLDNLLLSCLNMVSNTIGVLFRYNEYVLSLLAKAASHCHFLSAPTSHARNIVSCSCMDAAVAAFIPDVCCFGAACSLA